jgi:hypothetical protein
MPRAWLLLLLIPQLLGACTCNASWSACQSVAESNAVFTGTVESIKPSVLDYWNPSAHRNWLQDPELVELRKSKTAAGLKALKDRYLALLFDVSDADKNLIRSAEAQERLQAVIGWILHEGTTVRFKVSTTFQLKDDDDDDKKKDDDDKKKPEKSDFVEVWNEPGDCGISFQKGETYLVYAATDESSDRLQTNVCMRTGRLSDSGEDLAYLHFFQNGGSKSGRLEGFVTSKIEQLSQDRFHYSSRIGSPVSDVVVELQADGIARYTMPDAGGRFVFDGLAVGDYQVSAFERGFPDVVKLMSGPNKVRVEDKGCATTKLLVLMRSLKY